MPTMNGSVDTNKRGFEVIALLHRLLHPASYSIQKTTDPSFLSGSSSSCGDESKLHALEKHHRL